MSMSKADFQEVANAIQEAKLTVQYTAPSKMAENAGMRALETAAKELASACARQYKGGYGFNRSRFVEAAGFPEA